MRKHFINTRNYFILVILSLNLALNTYAHSSHRNKNWCYRNSNIRPCNGQKGRCIKNSDGSLGGFVSYKAFVAGLSSHGSTIKKNWWQKGGVYIGQYVYICDSSTISGNAKLLDYSKVMNNATVEKNVVLKDNVVVSSDATITDNMVLGKSLVVFDNVHVGGNGSILGDYVIGGESIILMDVNWDEEGEIPKQLKSKEIINLAKNTNCKIILGHRTNPADLILKTYDQSYKKVLELLKVEVNEGIEKISDINERQTAIKYYLAIFSNINKFFSKKISEEQILLLTDLKKLTYSQDFNRYKEEIKIIIQSELGRLNK